MRIASCFSSRGYWWHPLPFIAVLAVACERAPDTVVGPTLRLQAGAAPEDKQFYYYRGQPVYLDVDPEMITIATAEHDPRSSIGEALRAEGLTPGPLAGMANRRDHWEVQVQGDAPTAARALVARLRASRRFGFVANTYQVRGQAGPRLRLVNRVAVQFKTGVSRSSIDSLAQAVGLRLLSPANRDSARWSYVFAYPETEDPLRIAQRLDRHPLVEWADPVMHGGWVRQDVPTDPFYSLQYHLKNTESLNGHYVDINIEPAWTVTKGASTVRVAILDDGVDASHPDLQCKMASAEGADMFADHTPPYDDDEWHPNVENWPPDLHGTAVAGVIFSCHDNGNGIAGIAPGATMIAVRIFRRDDADNERIAQGIDKAWQQLAADVINNSWASQAPSNQIAAAIARAATFGRNYRGAVVVVAAGNYSYRQYQYAAPVAFPATLSEVIAVSAIDRYGALADYSGRGPEMDLVAPSSHFAVLCDNADFVSLDLVGMPGCNDGPPEGNIYDYLSTFGGTSAAAPQVAGVAALLLTQEPNLTRMQVMQRLLSAATYWGDPLDHGWGKLDAAWTLAGTTWDLLPVVIDGTDIALAYQQCQWTATVSNGTEPYTYSWTVDGVPVGGNSPTLAYSAGPSSFQIRVQVNDATARYGQAWRSVTIVESGMGCQQQ